jgi:hypothetical protein
LRYLLQIEVDRLEVARRIESERSIVFPETTVIVRDIQKLLRAVNGEEPEALDTEPSPGLLSNPWG